MARPHQSRQWRTPGRASKPRSEPTYSAFSATGQELKDLGGGEQLSMRLLTLTSRREQWLPLAIFPALRYVLLLKPQSMPFVLHQRKSRDPSYKHGLCIFGSGLHLSTLLRGDQF